MTTSIKDLVENAKKSEFKRAGGFYTVQDGNKNLVRILTTPEVFYKDYDNGVCYTDCGFQGSPVGLAYILDRADNQIKLMEVKWGLMQKLASWEESGDYEISGFPLKYDIRITKEGAGKATKYDFNVVPKMSEVPADFMKKLDDLKACSEIIEKMKEENKAEKGTVTPEVVGEGMADPFPSEEEPK